MKYFNIIFLLICVIVLVQAKKKCAPDSPHNDPIPKAVNGILPFCQQYQNLSCCDPTEARAIQRTVNELMHSSCPSCFAMVQEWKCSECHPHSGKFYKNERSTIKLCEDYCEHFFETCKDIPFDVYRYDGSAPTAKQWCKGNIAKEGSCFRGSMPTEIDTECKCADHKCHIKNPKIQRMFHSNPSSDSNLDSNSNSKSNTKSNTNTNTNTKTNSNSNSNKEEL